MNSINAGVTKKIAGSEDVLTDAYKPSKQVMFKIELKDQKQMVSSSLATSTQIIPLNDVSMRCFSIMNELNEDLIGEISRRCFSINDIKGIQSLACTNKHFYKNITMIVEKIDLKERYPLLKIVSAEEAQKCDFKAVPGPSFQKLSLIKGYLDMAPHIEDEAGVTYFDFILLEDLTLNQIVEIAKGQGIEVEFGTSQILSEIGDVATKQAFPCMLANKVFKNSRGVRYEAQSEHVRRHSCELPTVEQYIIQIVLIQKISGQCLFGKEPMTYGSSSTYVWSSPLHVGASAPGSLFVCSGGNIYNRGAGGQRKLLLDS
jgi:hypothetical protein